MSGFISKRYYLLNVSSLVHLPSGGQDGEKFQQLEIASLGCKASVSVYVQPTPS
jgi:hypothetical protein